MSNQQSNFRRQASEFGPVRLAFRPIFATVRSLGILVLALFLESYAVADASRQQTVQLSAGWNAVFLEVHPEEGMALT